MHESQSRLWENLIGRSRAFWQYHYRILQERFPEALQDVPLEAFYRGINRVAPSLIRVEADEVTYNLHIMLRFELETAMVSGDLAVQDLPEAWNAKTEDYLGLRPETDADGVLQDVHWSLGALGYFPTYTLGNLMSVQLFEKARADVEGLDKQIERGSFSGLLDWLRGAHPPVRAKKDRRRNFAGRRRRRPGCRAVVGLHPAEVRCPVRPAALAECRFSIDDFRTVAEVKESSIITHQSALARSAQPQNRRSDFLLPDLGRPSGAACLR